MMIRYPLAYNPILEYWNMIESGQIRVCRKIRKTYEKVVHDILNPEEWRYSPGRANHIMEFAENYCRHSKGKYGGKRVELELWEKAHLATVFGFINDDGIRKYQRSILIVAKKNGKSLLASIVGLYMLCADGEHGPEVYAAATKRDQAKIIWSEAVKMVRKSPDLLQRLKPRVAELRAEFNEGSFKPLASDSNSLDGLNISCCLMDEIHQWRNGKALYDILADGVTARENPLIYITSTAGTIREDIYDILYDEATSIIDGYFDSEGYKDERTICFIYELDDKKNWENEDCWIEANPGLGTIKNIVTFRGKIEKAKHDSRELKNLLTKEFNIPDTPFESWLTREEADNAATFDVEKLRPRYGIGGVDLSSTTDLTAAKVIFMVPNDPHIYVLQMYWTPEDLVEKRIREDHVPYDIWIDKGYMRTCAGSKINYRDVVDWFVEIQEKYDIYMFKIGYDRWSAQYFVEEMESRFGKSTMIEIAQGVKTLSDPMKLLRTELRKNIIVYNNHPIDRWCLYNTATVEDKNGNIQPKKSNIPTKRIDGTAALLDAYTVYVNYQDDYMSLI